MQGSDEEEEYDDYQGAKKGKKATATSRKSPVLPSLGKSHVRKGVEPSEWANIMLLNSGDNDKADWLQD